MTFKTTLSKALRAANVSVDQECVGVLLPVDNVSRDGSNYVLDMQGGDFQVTLPEQEIEVDSGGMAMVVDVDGVKHELEFEVVHRYALREDHLS